MNPKIHRPCPVDWNQMSGDQKSRHCGICNKSVHNIANLSKKEAETLLCTPGKSVCIRIQQTPEGNFLTKSGWMRRAAIAGAATLSLIPISACNVTDPGFTTGDTSIESQSNGNAVAPEKHEKLQVSVGFIGETAVEPIEKPTEQPPTTEREIGSIAAGPTLHSVAKPNPARK